MKGNCALCGKKFIMPDGPPTAQAPQYVYAVLAIDQPGIYQVRNYPVTTGTFGLRRWVTPNLQLIKEMPKVDSLPAAREALLCADCVKQHIGAN